MNNVTDLGSFSLEEHRRANEWVKKGMFSSLLEALKRIKETRGEYRQKVTLIDQDGQSVPMTGEQVLGARDPDPGPCTSAPAPSPVPAEVDRDLRQQIADGLNHHFKEFPFQRPILPANALGMFPGNGHDCDFAVIRRRTRILFLIQALLACEKAPSLALIRKNFPDVDLGELSAADIIEFRDTSIVRLTVKGWLFFERFRQERVSPGAEERADQ